MAFYHTLGEIPKKRHTIFKKENGEFYREQLFGTEGFSGKSSLLYHIHQPTEIASIGEPLDVRPAIAVSHNIVPRKLQGFKLPPQDDFLQSRTTILINSDLAISLAAPRKSMDTYFYKNASSDELLFIHEGTGVLKTMLGNLPFREGDYVIIPKGVIYQLEFNNQENRMFILESNSSIQFPKRYQNKHGQLLENSPFCERDIHVP